MEKEENQNKDTQADTDASAENAEKNLDIKDDKTDSTKENNQEEKSAVCPATTALPPVILSKPNSAALSFILPLNFS